MKRSQQATSSQKIFLCAWEINENRIFTCNKPKKMNEKVNEIRTLS